ncbi:TonB family protein [Trichocoleus desertorum AS-A10]|uniref:TonB family protein n=1 Tax=Trichocoleus desertorum TaxID=1481672 RepID=UPI003297CD42
MTPLIDPSAQNQSADWRRHADPPNLWLAVLSGSIVIHVLLALTLRWSIRVAIAQPSNASSAPIEVVDIAPETASIEAEAAAPTAPIAQDPVTDSAPPQADDGVAVLEPGVTAILPESVEATAPSPSPSPPISQPPQPSSATPPASLPFTPPVLPNPQASPEPRRDPEPEANVVPPPADNNQAPVAPDNGSETPTESNIPPEQTSEDTGALPAPEGQTGTTQEGSEAPLGNPDSASEESETESNSLPPGPTVPDSAPAPTDGGLGEAIGQVPVSQDPVPAEFQASLSVTEPGGPGAVDFHDQLATPKATSKTFPSDPTSVSGCVLVPESVQYFGQSVELRIAIDEQGRVLDDATVVRQSSGSESFDQLATCVIASWEFNPAFDRINNVESRVSSNLDVFVTIKSIN